MDNREPDAGRMEINPHPQAAVVANMTPVQRAQYERDNYIKRLAQQIASEVKGPLKEIQAQNQISERLVMRQLQVNLMLNQRSDDLAYRRQIVPATRGATKSVVYGN